MAPGKWGFRLDDQILMIEEALLAFRKKEKVKRDEYSSQLYPAY
jgi:hypothetical protein